MNGTWTGTMYHFPSGTTWTTVLEITQEAGSSEFSGSIQMTNQADPTSVDFFLIAGTLQGNHFQFHDTGTEVITMYFWGDVDGNSISGNLGLSCYDCSDMLGELTLNR